MTPVSLSHRVNDDNNDDREGPVQAGDNSNGIARAFVEARRTGSALADYPGTMPATLTAAYQVQDIALALTDRPVAGWKVGKIDPPVDGDNRLVGPIFADQVFLPAPGADPIAMPVFGDGFAAAEAEFLLRVGTAPDAGKSDYTIDAARALIDAVHVGIEIASSPFPGINTHGPAVTVSDFGNNNGLVVGAEAEGWQQADINAWPITLRINDAPIGAATAADMLDGPFGAACFLFNHLARRGIAVPSGTWISSGAVTGVHRVAIGDHVTATFDGRWSIGCTIAAR